jgi:septum formation protein
MQDKLILASSSPRRTELLNACHIKFEVLKHKFDEDSIIEKNPIKLAEKLAYGKAKSIAYIKEYHNKYVLGVDTIVVFKNHVLGKPKDKNEAEKFVRMLSNNKHYVISGISIVNNEQSLNLTRYSQSLVVFNKINDNFIKYYLDNNLWKGYAGGYAIQSIFSIFVKKIKGSYSNIVGLPVDILYKMLKDINFRMLW